MGLQLNCTSLGSVLQLGQVKGGPCGSEKLSKKGFVRILQFHVPLGRNERNVRLQRVASCFIQIKVALFVDNLIRGEIM